MGELKPCPNPWCNAKTRPLPVKQRDNTASLPWVVTCGCGVKSPWATSHDEAITAWNTRPRTEGRGEGEQVAWAYEYTNHLKGDRAPGGWLRAVAFEAPSRARVNAGFARNVQPLYASPIREPEISREAVAEAVHIGRFPPDREPTPFADEDRGGREYCFRIADAILNLAPAGGRGTQLEEIAALARELITTGMVNRGVDRGLVVVERDDKTDPHYRLCSALARLPPPPQEQGGMK